MPGKDLCIFTGSSASTQCLAPSYKCSVWSTVLNPGTYSKVATLGQGAGQTVSVVTTAVIPGTGNIPHYSSSRAGNQGTGRPATFMANLVNAITGHIHRYSCSRTGNQGQ